MVSSRTVSLLVGRDRATSRRWLVLALVLLCGVSLAFTAGFSWYRLPVSARAAAVVAAALVVFVAAVHGFRNDGLLVCLALGIAPATGLFVRIIGEGMSGPITPGRALVLGFLWGVCFGAPLGAVGFVLGAGAQRMRSQSKY